MPYIRPPHSNKLSPEKGKKWVKVFNAAYKYAKKQGWSKKRIEEYAHRVAWASVRDTAKGGAKRG